ncbi:MAG: RNA-dependent RNA polymerase [Hangzhou levivirus 1]|nr:MAG: RNA-dependent RNA polymerase [Hangzhou levivirus 1]
MTPFDTREFLSRVVHDLRACGVDIPGDVPRDPQEVRSWIARLDASAVAGIESISIHQFAGIQQLKACVSKLESFGAVPNHVRKDRALQKFLLSERACARANRRLRWYGARLHRLSPSLSSIIRGMQHRIAVWLARPMDWDEFGDCGFGPGLTFGMRSQDRHMIYKICGDQTVTPRARQLAAEVLHKHYPNWASHLAGHGKTLTRVRGNRITFVPKSADIYRTIAVEPSLNVFLQNGIDRALRRRMRPFGLTLDDQTQSITAMQANYQGPGGATIDLASASDSVAREAVRLLFPPDWYRLVDTVRSREYTLDKGQTWSTYEKFSSMGNGTTFPLESIIFYAAALECDSIAGDGSRVKVYGDDIVTSSSSALLLIEVLRFLGFKTNLDKTFIFGRFRECCGTDILDGVDVRPVFLRRAPKLPDEVAGLHNRLASSRYGFAFGSTLAYLVSLVQKPLFGPSYIGSGQKSFVHPSGVRAAVQEWYAGKCQLPDSYFFSRNGYSNIRLWSKWWHSGFVNLSIWHRGRKVIDRTGRRLTPFDRYIGFLYGLGERIYSITSDVKVRKVAFSGFWPDPSPHMELYDAIPDTLPEHFAQRG